MPSSHQVSASIPRRPPVIAAGEPLAPGRMHLGLYHGRTDPDQQMDSWGFVGPTVGPLDCSVHT